MSRPPVPGPFRPAAGRPEPITDARDDTAGSGHPAVDAVLAALANVADLPPADQIARYEAAHRTLRETLATIDQA